MRRSYSCLIYNSMYCDTAAIIQLIFHLIRTSLSQFLLQCPRGFQLFVQKVSCSRDGSLQAKGHEGPVSPAFPNAPNWASKRPNHPITQMFWKPLGFKMLSTQITGQCRSICKDSTHRGHGERGPRWAKHDTVWEGFLLQARMYRGTHSSCVTTNSLLPLGFNFDWGFWRERECLRPQLHSETLSQLGWGFHASRASDWVFLPSPSQHHTHPQLYLILDLHPLFLAVSQLSLFHTDIK